MNARRCASSTGSRPTHLVQQFNGRVAYCGTESYVRHALRPVMQGENRKSQRLRYCKILVADRIAGRKSRIDVFPFRLANA